MCLAPTPAFYNFFVSNVQLRLNTPAWGKHIGESVNTSGKESHPVWLPELVVVAVEIQSEYDRISDIKELIAQEQVLKLFMTV